MSRVLLSLLLLSGGLSAADAQQRRPQDQYRAREAMREGGMPLREIQQQWQHNVPGYDYLGADYDPGTGNYRLKFIREGSVMWVEVDGRSGREIARSSR